jgi:two-component system sensor histidine kinase YesM
MKSRLLQAARRGKLFFRQRSIQSTISLSFTVVMVIGLMLVAGSLSLRYVDSAKDIIAESNTRVVDQVGLNLDSYLRSMMRISDSVYYRVIKNVDLKTGSLSEPMSLLYETNRDQLVSIAVFSSDGKVIAAEPLFQLKPTVRVQNQDWFKKAAAKIENLHFSTPHVEDLFLDPDNKYHWVVSLSRSVELTEGGSIKHGVLLVDMNFSGIERICKNTDLGASGYVYIMDGSGEIIYHPKQELLYSRLASENNRAAAGYEDGTHLETFENEQRMITVKTVGYTGWKIVAVNSIQDVTAAYAQIRQFTLLVAGLASILLVFVNLFLSRRIATPIKALERSVKSIEDGDLDETKIAVGGSYEVEHLGNAIRSMVQKMRGLMADIVREQESKRKSELDALQAQINPHFLYNTLDSIVWMTEKGQYRDAVVMVTSLAKLFRISLSKGRNIIPVSAELEHVRNYLIIQNYRYKNKFRYSIDAQPEALRCVTIKLIVQPLVENSIYHGMEYMDNDGEIKIRAYLKGDDLFIDVADNGPGIPEERAAALFDGSTPTGKGSGIGLKNIRERIQLYFGKQYGLSLFSEPDVGTTAQIHLPAVTMEEFERRNPPPK